MFKFVPFLHFFSKCCLNAHGRSTSQTQGSLIITTLRQRSLDGLNPKSWKIWKVRSTSLMMSNLWLFH